MHDYCSIYQRIISAAGDANTDAGDEGSSGSDPSLQSEDDDEDDTEEIKQEQGIF